MTATSGEGIKGINEIKSFGKAFGKYILPKEVIEEYRSQLQIVNDSVLIITLDSCRYDAFIEAYDNQLPAKKIRKAYSPCNWTLPSHESIVRGFIPYGDFVDPLTDKNYNRGFPLPSQHSYSFGSTAMPYLSSSSALENNIHSYFEDYHCSEKCNSSDKVLEKASKFIAESEEHFFGLINLGETHTPYKDFESQTAEDIFKDLESGEVSYEELYNWQVESARLLLEKISEFREKIPEGTTVIVTSDHGELFGEKDAFGHGENAVFHRKLFQVPLIYWNESGGGS